MLGRLQRQQAVHRPRKSILAVLLLGLFSGRPIPALATENPQLVVYVYNDAQASLETLTSAEQHAGRIFSKAGFDITWRNCPCIDGAFNGGDMYSTAVLVLHVTTHIAATTSDPTFGVAFLDENGVGRYADIFWQKVQHFQFGSQVNLAAILGSVMAHEMGHLLLGSNAHAIGGIMQPRWNAAELHRIAMGTFLFLPEQVQAMHARVSRAALIATQGHAGN